MTSLNQGNPARIIQPQRKSPVALDGGKLGRARPETKKADRVREKSGYSSGRAARPGSHERHSPTPAWRSRCRTDPVRSRGPWACCSRWSRWRRSTTAPGPPSCRPCRQRWSSTPTRRHWARGPRPAAASRGLWRALASGRRRPRGTFVAGWAWPAAAAVGRLGRPWPLRPGGRRGLTERRTSCC